MQQVQHSKSATKAQASSTVSTAASLANLRCAISRLVVSHSPQQVMSDPDGRETRRRSGCAARKLIRFKGSSHYLIDTVRLPCAMLQRNELCITPMKHADHRSRDPIGGTSHSEPAFVRALCFCFFSCFGYEDGVPAKCGSENRLEPSVDLQRSPEERLAKLTLPMKQFELGMAQRRCRRYSVFHALV